MIIRILAICILVHSLAFAQTAEKSKFIGDYTFGYYLNNESDTISRRLFITLDSFVIIYIVRHDSDYSFPLLSGVWYIDDEDPETINLKYPNGSEQKGILDASYPDLKIDIENHVYTRLSPDGK